MIKTYGLHWSSDKVHWGRRGRGGAGQLLGYAGASDRENPVDFREQAGIYALYYDFDLVYIGQTGAGDSRLLARLKSHLSDHLAERWDRFSWFGTRWVTKGNELSADTVAKHIDTGNALNLLEAVAIAIAEPRLNLQRGSWGNDVGQFFQLDPDDEREPA